jgi:hypothetical protein
VVIFSPLIITEAIGLVRFAITAFFCTIVPRIQYNVLWYRKYSYFSSFHNPSFQVVQMTCCLAKEKLLRRLKVGLREFSAGRAGSLDVAFTRASLLAACAYIQENPRAKEVLQFEEMTACALVT